MIGWSYQFPNMNPITDSIKEQSEQLLSLIGIQAEVSVELSEEVYFVQLNTQDTGVLIGYHGQNMASLQTILSQLIFKKHGEWVKLSININDYWQKRQEQLEMIAKNASNEVVVSKSSYTLPYLNAKERRHIHMLLDGVEGISTESVGEGRERRLVVFPA